MEKKFNKINGHVNANVDLNGSSNLAAAANAMTTRKDFTSDAKSNAYSAQVTAEMKDAEITGSDTFEIKLEGPFGIKIELKATSNVTSSVLAQEKINEQARKNLELLGSGIMGAIMAFNASAPAIAKTIRDIENENAINDHANELDRIKADHEARMLRLKLDAEYNEAAHPVQDEEEILND